MDTAIWLATWAFLAVLTCCVVIGGNRRRTIDHDRVMAEHARLNRDRTPFD
jgi:hypothetical protein